MKAIRVEQFGGPEVMKLQDASDPKADQGQLVVRMKAIGVNPVDTYIRSGTMPENQICLTRRARTGQESSNPSAQM